MINNEWERSLDELNRTIQDAIDHQNYGRLNQNVTDTIGRAMEGLSRGLRNGIRYGSDAMNAAADNFAQRQRQAGNTPPFHNQGTGSAGGFTQNQGAAQQADSRRIRGQAQRADSRRIRGQAQLAVLRRIRGQAQLADSRRIRGQAQQADLHRIRGQAQRADLHIIRERAQQAASRRIKEREQRGIPCTEAESFI